MCPVCGVPLSVAESPQAERERAFIRDLYNRGQTEAQIKRAMVDQFGSSVLVLPPHHGFNLSAYLVPLIALAALLAGLAVLLVRWRWRRPAGVDPPAPAASLTPGESRRLDEDLARWRG
jgi:cytochrome c-type biogenesis protein CcmH/NrfF